MKWIGQDIYDHIVRFRNTVVIDDVSISAVQTSAESFADDDVSIMTSAAIDDRINTAVTAEDLDVAGDSGTAAVDLNSQSFTVQGGTNITTAATGQRVSIALDNPIAGPIEIEQANDGGGSALLIDNDDVDQQALEIDAANTTASIFKILAPDLTSGLGIYINADSLTTGAGIKIDSDDALTTSATKSLSIIDYDKAGVTASGQLSKTIGLDINLADAATNHASGAVTMIGAQVDVDSANAQGTITQKGLIVNVAADGVGDASITRGVTLTTMDGAADIRMRSHADTGDYCDIATTTHGATTITTVDDDAAAAHFEIAADGDITLDSAGDIALECGGGDLTCDADTVTFSSANADDPQVTIKNTTDDAQESRLRFVKNRGAAGEDGDNAGMIEFYSYDDGGTPSLQEYGRILTEIHDATDGEESGAMKFGVANHDGGNGYGLTLTGGSVDDEVDATIGLGAASVTTVAGDLTVTGDLTISGDTLSYADQNGRRAYFQFKGYGTSDGTNYDMSLEMTDNQAPFQHDTSTGADGLTAQTTTTILRSGGKVMPYAGVLKKFTGWAASQGTGTVDVGIFKFTPVDNNNSNVAAALLINTQVTAAGNTKMRSFTEDSFDIAFAAGDILYSAVNGGTASKLWYMNSTLEVEWS